MRRFGRIAALMFFGLLSLALFSCDNSNSKDEPSNDPRGSYTLTAFVDDGDGQFHKMELPSISLRALERGAVNIGSAVVTGLGDYFHNETCEIGINPKPNSGAKVKLVTFDYQAGYDPKMLPTSVLEYNNRTKPSNPKGYDVNFVFPVIGDVKVFITMEGKEGVDIDIDDEGGKGKAPGVGAHIDTGN
ncbi:hypothetical protein [Porphyromonas somerae]|uniref:hypothetical protein n=1 Tax=Porphyromonas somerae TaxID=322095 RepID=UPI002A807C7B|nr:hypothetical protein [Porphyromonas somerae]MDY3885426.1 hypothetical protein [Porphyromonas somerae]